MNLGIFANDPGGTTGLAWGIFNPHADSIEEAIATRLHSGSCDITGDAPTQIREIASIWQSFYRTCVNVGRLPVENVLYIAEDFVPAGGAVGGESQAISLAVLWGVEGYRMGQADEFKRLKRGAVVHCQPVVRQLASHAKGFGTGPRLKTWGVWVKGSDHQRSAWSHIAYYLQKRIIAAR